MGYYNRSNRKPKVGTPQQRSKAATFLNQVHKIYMSRQKALIRKEFRKHTVGELCEAWNFLSAAWGGEMTIHPEQLLCNDERSVGKRLAYAVYIYHVNAERAEREMDEAEGRYGDEPSPRRGGREDFHADG